MNFTQPFQIIGHRIGLALQQERVESLAPSICFGRLPHLRAFDLWVTSATLGSQVSKAVVLKPTWPGITSSHYPWKFQKTRSQNGIFNETITAFLSGTMGAWLNFHFGWQDKEIFFKSLCFHVVCIMLNTEWRDLWIDEWKSLDIVVMHPLSFVESPQKRKYFLARGTESTGLSGVAKVAELEKLPSCKASSPRLQLTGELLTICSDFKGLRVHTSKHPKT